MALRLDSLPANDERERITRDDMQARLTKMAAEQAAARSRVRPALYPAEGV